jgi:hypothetical protein
LFVVETVVVVLVYNLGVNMMKNEESCKYDVCGDVSYDSFYYDDYSKDCYCLTQGEVLKQVKISE